jgi:hypothetical protein
LIQPLREKQNDPKKVAQASVRRTAGRGLDMGADYVGQTRTPLSKRLGPNGYATITTYNTLARQPGRTNGGQQTNCRVNALSNQALVDGHQLAIWYRVTPADRAHIEEARWMTTHGKPEWNRRLEQSHAD